MKHQALLRLRAAATVGALLWAVGCQSTAHVHVTESPTAQFDRYRTVAFAFDVTAQPPRGYVAWADSAEVRAEVRDSASTILAGFGYDLTTPDKADLILRIEEGRRDETVPTRTVVPGSNGGRGAAELQGPPAPPSEEETHGSFVIQALDARTGRLVWRGSAENQVTPGSIDHTRLRSAVESVLRTFPQPAAPAK
jgi:hypothetical protein